MTGYGAAADAAVAIEIRTVNNRHLKVSVRGSEPYAHLESEFEKRLRGKIHRGSIAIQIRVTRSESAERSGINPELLTAALHQIQKICREAGTTDLAPSVATGLLNLPGMAGPGGENEADWLAVESVLNRAIDQLQESRKVEGRAMALELASLNRAILAELDSVKERIPQATEAYRKRILERVRQAIGDAGIAVEPEHVIREVALFADRTDVAEEAMRLAAHAAQFAELVEKGAADGAGRRLEFIVQEMGREINTLGSKAGDPIISRHGVEMKAALEKIRELIQNVE